MLGLTGSVVLARISLNVVNPKGLDASDYFVFLAFTFYATICALYIAVSPYMERVYDVSVSLVLETFADHAQQKVINGSIVPYNTMEKDTMVITKMIFAVPCFFWSTLWSVKISLLLYRKMLVGFSKRYTIIWWGIMAVCIPVTKSLLLNPKLPCGPQASRDTVAELIAPSKSTVPLEGEDTHVLTLVKAMISCVQSSQLLI